MAITRSTSSRTPKTPSTPSTPKTTKPTRRRATQRHTTPVCPHEAAELTHRPAERPGWTTPRTSKPLSQLLENWINNEVKHGYSFREDVLLGDEPDEDYGTRFPCDWAQVKKCLKSELRGERMLACSESEEMRRHFDRGYYSDCMLALKEVRMFYL